MATIKRKSLKTAVGRRPKPTKPDQDSRAAILTAARTVFAHRGFEGAPTREVADVAGVNNAMIYYHFRDKNELYRSVLADSFTAFDRIWEHTIFRSTATVRTDRKFCPVCNKACHHTTTLNPKQRIDPGYGGMSTPEITVIV